MNTTAPLPRHLLELRWAQDEMLQNTNNLREAADLIDSFQAEVLGHVQYAGYFAQHEVAVVQLRRDTSSKSGRVGTRGQRLVGLVERGPVGISSVVVYSPWSGFHVSLPTSYYKVIALSDPTVLSDEPVTVQEATEGTGWDIPAPPA